MTVGDLIQELQKLDPALAVVRPDGEGDWTEIEMVEIGTATLLNITTDPAENAVYIS